MDGWIDKAMYGWSCVVIYSVIQRVINVIMEKRT